VAAALFAVIVVASWLHGYMRLWPMAGGFLAAFFGAILISMAATMGVVYLGRLAVKAGIWTALTPHGENLGSILMTLSLWNVALALMTLLHRPGRGKTTMAGAATGYAALWVALCLTTSFFLPGASFLFTWPLLLALGGHGIILLRKPGEPLSWLKELAVLLSGIATIVLPAQAVYLFFIALAPHAVPGVLVPMLLSVLTMGLLLPQLQLAASRQRWALPTAGMVGAVACFVGGRLANGFGM
jgi:hypothetical protein